MLLNLLAVQLQDDETNWAAIVAVPSVAVLIAVFTAVSVTVAVSIKKYQGKNNENECISNPHDNDDKLTTQPNQAYGTAGAHEQTVHPYDTTEATVKTQ